MMNTAGLAILVRMGNCFCFHQNISINGRKYRVRDTLGEGGFSCVELVEDVLTHKLFALKKITCHSPQDEKVAIAEIEYQKSFSNPYIIEYIDSDMIGIQDMAGNPITQVRILLPYYQRGTLNDELMNRMKDGKHLEEIVVLTLFRNICEGLSLMHSSKPHPLAHRDLKAANILIKNDLAPLIMDLGSMARARITVSDGKIARQLQDEAAERSSMPYRAPELFNVEQNATIDERTDIWSLGCLLYALCFYKSPFETVYERGDSVALAVVSGKITFPETHPYSQDLIELIQKLIKVNAEERPYIDWVIQKTDELIKKRSGAV